MTGESPVFLEISGSGQLLVNAFGRLVEFDVEDALTVDTGHLVAFENTLQYSITKAGSSWIQSWLAGEGVVMKFTGRGRIVTQSHNPRGIRCGIGRTASSSQVVAATMQYKIICDPTYSAVEVSLNAGERIVGDSGAMAWMSANIKTETTTRGGLLAG